jgi:hypothetical protein
MIPAFLKDTGIMRGRRGIYNTSSFARAYVLSIFEFDAD